MVRDAYVLAALTSIRKLRELLPELSEEEIETCLCLESESRRRTSVLTELVQRLVDLNRQFFILTLKEKHSCLLHLPL